MPLSPEKRAFLLRLLGPRRTKEIEDCLGDATCSADLAQKERERQDYLTGVKQGEMAVLPSASPYGGATSWATLRTHEDATEVWAQFDALLTNIRLSGKPPAEQAKLVKAAADGLLERLSGLAAGGKAKRNSVSEAIREDLLMLFGPKKPISAKAMKEIEALGDATAPYLADLVAGRVVKGD